MNRIVCLIALACLLMAAACGDKLNEMQVVALDSSGQIIKNNDGTVVLLTHKMTDEGAYYHNKSQIAASRKPLFEMRARDGEDITLSGVEYVQVWGHPGEYAKLPLYEGQWVRAAREWGGIAGNILLSAVNAWGYTELARALVDKVGGGTTVYGDYNAGEGAGSNRDNPWNYNYHYEHNITDSYKWTTTTGAE